MFVKLFNSECFVSKRFFDCKIVKAKKLSFKVNIKVWVRFNVDFYFKNEEKQLYKLTFLSE